MLVSIGILAHNEERDIGGLFSDLAAQTLVSNALQSLDIHVVANGCTDNTVEVSNQSLASPTFQRNHIRTLVHAVERAGKSLVKYLP